MIDYHGEKWERKRRQILRRDRYMCQISKRYGKARQADTVHHIFPCETFPQYEWCDWNLISLTHRQHNALHIRETHELSKAGRELLRRTARMNNIPIPEEMIS